MPLAKAWKIRITKIDISIFILISVVGISMYSYIDQGAKLRGFPHFSHFWFNYFYAISQNLKIQDLKNWPKKTCWFSYLEVSLEFPCTLISTRGLYWGAVWNKNATTRLTVTDRLNYFDRRRRPKPENSGSKKSTCWFSFWEVLLEFPCTLISTRGLYCRVSPIFCHFWLNCFYAVS